MRIYRSIYGEMRYLKLTKRKECWTLTFFGWSVLILSTTFFITIAVTSANQFLALERAVKAEILVVEGWLPDYALEKVVEEFRKHDYRKIVTLGGPIEIGSYLSEHKTYAELAGSTLKRLGIDEEFIATVPASREKKDRTYASALALKNWLHKSDLSISSMNIYSLGPHARRSWLLFNNVFDGRVEIGVLNTADRDYDPNYWWKTSNGVRSVLDELIAYCYARFFFLSKSESTHF